MMTVWKLRMISKKFKNFRISVNGMDVGMSNDFSVASVFLSKGHSYQFVDSFPIKTSVQFNLEALNTKPLVQLANRQLLQGTHISTLKGNYHG